MTGGGRQFDGGTVLLLKNLLGTTSAEYSDWIVWGVADDPCPSCAGPLCAAAAFESTALTALHVLVCLVEKSTHLSTDLPMASQHLLVDRFTQVLDKSILSDANNRLVAAARILTLSLSEPTGEQNIVQQPTVSSSSGSSAQRVSSIDVPIPEGYRSVS